MPVVRKARAADAGKLSGLAEATFRATFGPMNTVEHMERHCRLSYGERIQADELADEGMVTLVVEAGGGLIAYAQVCWGDAPDCVSARNPGEIRRLYVAEGWHGKGVAQELMQACLGEIGERGSDAVWLGVWERNPRAMAFYRKFGFVEVGDHTFSLGGDPQRDIVMVRPMVRGQGA